MSDNIINHVRDLRLKAGLTQAELGKILGISRQSIIAMEKGDYIPSVLLALKIAGFFRKTVDDIFHIAFEK